MIVSTPWERGPGRRTWDWLFGPTTEYLPSSGPNGPVRVRSVTLDMDTVVEIAALLKEWSGADPIYTLVRGGVYGDREVTESELSSLPAEDRVRLVVRVSRSDIQPALNGLVTFHNNPMVNVDSVEARDKIVAKLLHNPARANWRLVARLLPLALPLALIGFWVWFEALQAMPLPAHALGWLALLGLFVTAIRSVYKRRNDTILGPGHRIRMESRAQTIARRADEKKNLKVAFITAIITAPVTVAATLFVTLLTGD